MIHLIKKALPAFLLVFLFSYKAKATGTDTLIYLTNDHTCSMYIGFYIDYDEVEFLYNLKADSSCGISDCRLLLFDRWGTLQGEIKDTMLTYAVGYSHDPYHGSKEFYYKFSYKYRDGTEKKYVGLVRDPWF